MTDNPIYMPTTALDNFGRCQLQCNSCGKTVSSPLVPMINEMGITLVVRAWIECPECMEQRMKESPFTEYVKRIESHEDDEE